MRVLKIVFGYAILRGKFLDEDHTGAPRKSYSATVIHEKRPVGSSP
jgi:hypothetical protein